MATNYITRWEKIQGACFAALVALIFSAYSPIIMAQQHVHGETCGHPGFTEHSDIIYQKIADLENNSQFLDRFKSKYQFDYASFTDVNRYFIGLFRQEIAEQTFGEKNTSPDKIEKLLFELTDKFKERDDLWFEVPADHGVDVIYYGKHGFNPIPKKDSDDGAPKTAACINAGFEENSWNGWETICATAANGINVVNLQNYSPPGGCTSPAGSPQQHSLWTGGADAIGGFPRVFNGGVSAMLGNGAQANNPQHQAAVLRKQFVVDPNNTILTYSYAAVLDNRGGHTAAQQPFFNVRLLVNGVSVACAAYSATAGDGQPGWINAGNIFYRDWTTIAVPLQAYIGETVTLEFSVSDCFVGGGTHYGYAYVDVSCDNMEVDQFCEGGSTVLSAPSNGIIAYEWSTGETTQQITITTPGEYSVYVQPYGSPCSALLTYNASLYPVPTADFSVDHSSICIGGDISFTDLSIVETGGTISSYQWNFGDGISTPASTGTISGVPQTTGTYTAPNHVYNVVGNGNVSLTIETSDGCTSTFQLPVSVIEGPEAVISGNNTVCAEDTPPEITFTGSLTPGPYTFTYNVNGGPDQYISTTLPSSSVTLPVPTSPPGTYNYNLTYVADPSTAQCEQAQTGTVSIVVNPLPSATIAASAVVCQGDAAPVITFTGSNGAPGSNYQFTYSVNGGAPETISTSGGSSNVTVNVSTAVADTFEYILHTVTDLSTGCSDTITGSGNSSTIVVNPTPDAAITGETVVCQDDTPPVITFTGNNSHGDYTFVYSINGGSSQTITVNDTDVATVNVPTNIADTYTYELISVSDPLTGCGQNVNETQVVVVNPLPTAVINGTTTLCQNASNPQITFTGNDGTSEYQFTYSINGGVHQTVTTSGSNTVTVDVPTSTATVYTYTLHSVMDVATGCFQTQTGSAVVTINPMPDGSNSGTTAVCQGDTPPLVTFTGLNSSGEYAFSYTVNGGPTQTVTTSGTNTATVTQSTAVPDTFVYELINVMDPATLCSQDVSSSVTIIVRPLPVASISSPVEACHMDAGLPEVIFTGSDGEAPYTFAYNINGGATQYAASTGNTATFQIPTNTVGTFIYTITNIQDGSTLGCQQAQNISTIVSIHALPTVSAGTDFSVCAEVPIVLTGSGAQTYTWDNGVSNGVPFTPSDTTTYTVIGTDHNGCQNTDQITVNVVPIPVMDIIGTNLSGCQPVVPTFTNNSTGNLTDCTWYLGNGEVLQGCGTVASVFDSPGCFDVTLVVSTPEGCTNTLTLNNYVCVDAQPVADFYPDPSELTTYNWESQMVNESIGATDYVWDFGDDSAPSYAHSPTHAFPNDYGGIYTVMLVAITNNGCVDTAYATVTVKEELIFYVPNSFTPDNDDYNETFKPVFTTGFDPYNYTLLIFNRWGELIFESHDTNVGWNGKYGVDGKLCQDGTYTWKISVKRRLVSEYKEFVGHVNLLR